MAKDLETLPTAKPIGTPTDPLNVTPAADAPAHDGEDDGGEDDGGEDLPQTAQAAIDRIKKAEYATSEDRENAMKKWPHLFAETAEN